MEEIKWYPLPSYAALYTWMDFREYVKDGLFIDYDGTGRWANSTSETNITIKCKNFLSQVPPEGCTHVAWYNK